LKFLKYDFKHSCCYCCNDVFPFFDRFLVLYPIQWRSRKVHLMGK